MTGASLMTLGPEGGVGGDCRVCATGCAKPHGFWRLLTVAASLEEVKKS